MCSKKSENALKTAILQAFEIRKDEEIIAFRPGRGERRAFTGAQLRQLAENTAKDLHAWLGTGPHVLVLALPTGIEFVTTLLGAIMADVTVVPVPVPRKGSQSERFQKIVENCGASAILSLPQHLELIRSTLSQSELSKHPVVALPLGEEALPRPYAPALSAVTSAIVVQYTSGSTRAPKGVCISSENILANCRLVQTCWGMDATARFVNWLPHYHDMGLMGGILYPLLSGGFSAQLDPLDFIRRPARWLHAISEERASFSGGATFGFAECLRRVPQATIADFDLSSWTRAFCGAEPVPAGFLDMFHERFAPAGLQREALFACYGMAEATLFAAGLPGSGARFGTMEPCYLNEDLQRGLAIVNPQEKQRLPVEHEGEIWLRGPSQGKGYLHLPTDTAAQFDQVLDGEKGWLRTGDLGLVKNNTLFVTGRIKDILISNGRKFAAPEIEWLACKIHRALNPLSTAAFMAEPDRAGRAVLIAEVHLGSSGPIDPQDTCSKIRRVILGEYGLDLVDVLLVPRGKLPRTSSGKIQRYAVAEAWRNRAFEPLRIQKQAS